MTVPNGQTPVQERTRAHAEQVLGPQTAKRLAPFHDGVLYVEAGRWALGAVVTGTQLVRAANGDRIGGKAAWAMLVRLLMPLLVIGTIIGALGGGGPVPGGTTARVSVDLRAARRLRAAGIT
jgi:hypothetical protein